LAAVVVFLPPTLIDLCLAEFDTGAMASEESYDGDQERLKRSIIPEAMSPAARTLFYAFNSLPFIRVIENITGIKGLTPDPYFFGGGFHEIGQGGHLSIHADFNHHRPLNLERRVNVLIYLNKDWKDDYGGQLELWDTAMTGCRVSVVPEANRCVIFNTRSDTYHGNPNPIAHPGGITRKSIALYYYTATWTGESRSHITQFKARPKSEDKFDWAVKRLELMEDFFPPIVLRAYNKAKRKARAMLKPAKPLNADQ
jgi:hypothetical protein